MPRILYDTTTSTLQPYPRADDEDVVGLDPRYISLRIQQEPEPTYDPSTYRLEATESIDFDSKTLIRGWNLIALPEPPPSPNWNEFKRLLLKNSTINQIMLQAYSVCPAAASTLIPSLLNQNEDFSLVWRAILEECDVTSEMIQEIINIAESCNLPEDFILSLNK